MREFGRTWWVNWQENRCSGLEAATVVWGQSIMEEKTHEGLAEMKGKQGAVGTESEDFLCSKVNFFTLL